MAVIDLYSKRQKKLRGEQPDVYSYEVIPKKFQIQVIQIVTELFGKDELMYENIVTPLRKEYGVFELTKYYHDGVGNYSYRQELFKFFKNNADHEQCLDVIELAFEKIATSYSEYQAYIDELNARFKENGLGYQFENKRIIRMDSELLHSETVKPALLFLFSPDYITANKEFLAAYDYYKKGKFGDANHNCRNAFESVMKIICSKRDYKYDNDKDTVKKLLRILKENKFFPDFAEDHLNNLVGLLQGIGTVSNKRGTHGEGTRKESIPQYVTGYLLHTTASAILFFSEIEKNR